MFQIIELQIWIIYNIKNKRKDDLLGGRFCMEDICLGVLGIWIEGYEYILWFFRKIKSLMLIY